MGKIMVPNSRPKLAESEARRILITGGVDFKKYPVAFLGVRGYYEDTMGQPGVNDRGIYDDAIFVVSLNAYGAFNANTDPSYRRDKTKTEKGIATLKPGMYLYCLGNHGQSRPGGGYPAFRPATKDELLPVFRDGDTNPNAMGQAINIHRGGYNSTSSEGCQTIYPTQYDSFYGIGSGEMKRYKQTKVPYLLINGI